MNKFNAWVFKDQVDVFGRFTQITFAKDIYGNVGEILKANFDTKANLQTVAEMRQRAEDRIEYETERFASR